MPEKARRDPLLEEATFVRGLLTRVTEENGQSHLDIAFPAEDGDTRLLGDMLIDLEQRLVASKCYAEFRLTLDVRGGGFVVDSLVAGYGGAVIQG